MAPTSFSTELLDHQIDLDKAAVGGMAQLLEGPWWLAGTALQMSTLSLQAAARVSQSILSMNLTVSERAAAAASDSIRRRLESPDPLPRALEAAATQPDDNRPVAA